MHDTLTLACAGGNLVCLSERVNDIVTHNINLGQHPTIAEAHNASNIPRTMRRAINVIELFNSCWAEQGTAHAQTLPGMMVNLPSLRQGTLLWWQA